MSLKQISVIDLSQIDSQHDARIADEIRFACHEYGFFYVINHGVEKVLLDDYWLLLKRFFELPGEIKESINKIHSPHFRGWESLGSELTNNQVDHREQLDIGPEREALTNPYPHYERLIGPNQWPTALPGFQECVLTFMAKMSTVARRILSLMSMSLGLDSDQIHHSFGEIPGPYLKLIRYPSTPSGSQGVGIHKDSGYLTLLLQDNIGGLEAQACDGKWYGIRPREGAFVVNVGELLQMITHHYFIAAPHRVVNAKPVERFSSAFFYSPDLHARLDPLPLGQGLIEQARRSAWHQNAGFMPSRQQILMGTQKQGTENLPRVFGHRYWQRWERSYPEIVRKYYPQDYTADS
ncbi:MAG: isopenicillin N synthase family oxygenase [Gammaproteobacteria bacterium]|nr:isopenicillin N synthase family oxygenase [Gammaproteobacteria bacterium]